VICERAYDFTMGSLAPVTIVWCSFKLTEALVMPVMLSAGIAGACGMPVVLLVADIGIAGEAYEALPVASSDIARALVTNCGRGSLLASMFSLFETDFGSISWLCTYIEWFRSFSLVIDLNIYLTWNLLGTVRAVSFAVEWPSGTMQGLA
jgi:hypothetical protein